ncbi:MAG TPA: hypothetical protein VLG36_02870 [Candidatus Chromulinivoraceae bacterium]|nr:hypothetical protein [Candidatus Chromulinivoraceae bacterium]
MDRLTSTLALEHPPTLEILTEVPPLAVDLGERATALAAIMEYLNQFAKTSGAKRSGKAFSRRYGDRSLEVLRGMEAKRHGLRLGFDEGLDTLVAGRALRARGVDEEEIEQQRLAMQVAINRRFGVGKTDGHDRAEVVHAAQRVVHN